MEGLGLHSRICDSVRLQKAVDKSGCVSLFFYVIVCCRWFLITVIRMLMHYIHVIRDSAYDFLVCYEQAFLTVLTVLMMLMKKHHSAEHNAVAALK